MLLTVLTYQTIGGKAPYLHKLKLMLGILAFRIQIFTSFFCLSIVAPTHLPLGLTSLWKTSGRKRKLTRQYGSQKGTLSAVFLVLAPGSIHTQFFYYLVPPIAGGFPGGSEGKESSCNSGDLGWIPGLKRSPGEGNGNPLQYSYLENPMDGGAWQAIVHGVAKSLTPLKGFTLLSSKCYFCPRMLQCEFLITISIIF